MKAKLIKYGAICSKCHCEAGAIMKGEKVTVLNYYKNKKRMYVKRGDCIALADAETIKIMGP